MKTKVSKDLVGASTRMMVLGAVSREASWGYDIVRRLNESADGLFEWSEGTVYPVLHKLETEGLIRGKWQESEASRRRKYYSITPKGRAALTGGAEQWSAFGKLITQLAGARHA